MFDNLTRKRETKKRRHHHVDTQTNKCARNPGGLPRSSVYFWQIIHSTSAKHQASPTHFSMRHRLVPVLEQDAKADQSTMGLWLRKGLKTGRHRTLKPEYVHYNPLMYMYQGVLLLACAVSFTSWEYKSQSFYVSKKQVTPASVSTGVSICLARCWSSYYPDRYMISLNDE